MDKELEDRIFNDFPEFFKNRDNIRMSLMSFGFECGNGWYKLIYKLCADIREYYLTQYEGVGYEGETYYHEIPPHFSVEQVKEKWGALCFYISAAPEFVHELIRKAELKSYTICEHCGKELQWGIQSDGVYRSFYRDELPWILTLCDECLRVHLAERGLPFKPYISDWQYEVCAPYQIFKGGKNEENN